MTYVPDRLTTGLFALAVGALLGCGASGPPEASDAGSAAAAEPAWAATTFDSAYAAHLGADDYGMRPYVLVLLRKGPNRGQDSLEAARLQRAHLDNMQRWAAEGLLVAAGPTYGLPADETLQGLYVFALGDVAAVDSLAREDPAVAAGRLVLEAYPWYSSAALMDVDRIHGRVAREGI